MIRLIAFILLLFSNLLATTYHIAYDSSAMSKFSKKDMIIASDVWLKEITKGTGYKLDFKYYDDMSEMAADINAGKLDFITGFGLNFIKYFDLSKLEDGFGSGFLNGEKETFVLIVNKKSGIESWSGLKDRKIGLDENDEIAKLYIQSKMYETFQTKEIKLVPIASRQRALLKLFFGKVDAVIATNKSFDLMKELNPQVEKKLKIIDYTQLQATSFGFFRKGIDAKMKTTLTSVSKGLGNDERGKQLLMLYKSQIIVETKLEDLKPIKDLYEKSFILRQESK
ncbi:PhnD/SsuA/transferrin family substrate-binding protein [Candidatus Sulfurimonas marisnigri]|uniref:PhnD/SsuA/transferrin family substrate-binding protein n=1 Tax=Candidatus Sulfurimonas marisnigri TaxID=2740405 RepID=A0A7S7LZD2_9BACT|nr:PhnD/SsuA/transferrin family substrate-binding protein [Candidatus Sulfurimonas marisnigri]QOY54217.1 PhnD/SsuA/transferrin family substrate-binding protein [Candidatus Sulfurimonas marisnigri]